MNKRQHTRAVWKKEGWCIYENLVLDPNSVLSMKVSAEKPALRKVIKS